MRLFLQLATTASSLAEREDVELIRRICDMYFDGVRSGDEGNELPAGYVRTAEASGGPPGALPRGRCAGRIRCARQKTGKTERELLARFARLGVLSRVSEKKILPPRTRVSLIGRRRNAAR